MNAPQIKGYCPGALRPMQSGDGLLVRVRITAGRLTPHLARGLSEIAQTHGNGEIDLSQRANLQMRGVTWESLSDVHTGLRALGVLDDDAASEAVRNVLTSPFASERGLKLARDLEAALLITPALHHLPGKFGFAVDDAAGRLGSARADITARETATGFDIWLDGAPNLSLHIKDAAANMLEIAAAFLKTRAKRIRHVDDPASFVAPFGFMPASAPPPPLAHMPIGVLDGTTLGLGLPFGRINAAQLRALGNHAHELRLTPWRGILIIGDDPAETMNHAAGLGLITSATDPRLTMDACPGLGACSSAWQPTRPLGEALAKALKDKNLPALDLHISGCSKGCARRGPADYLLIATDTGYQLHHVATQVQGTAEEMIAILLEKARQVSHP